MSFKKQIRNLSKLYSTYEESPQKFSGEADVDSSFSHNFCDFPQSHHWIVRVSGGSIKKKFAIKLFRFFDTITKQR